MFNIASFLSKFSKLGHTDQAVVLNAKSVIQNNFNYSLDAKSIRFSGGVVYISAPSAVKNEIFLNKQRLLHELNKNGPKVLDIK